MKRIAWAVLTLTLFAFLIAATARARGWQYPPAFPVESVYGPGDYRVFTTSINVELDAGGGFEVIRPLHLRDLDGKVLQQHRVDGLAAFQAVSDVFTHEKDHLYGPDGRAFAVQANGGLPVKYLAADHLGTVRLVTNHEGVLLGRHDYYPFGQELYRENQADDRMHKFTGHERDYSNLTDYMLGRTYLYPKFRFASPDPARDGWNLYAYAGNNPVNLVDPTGLAPSYPAKPLVSYETASGVRDDVTGFLQDIGLGEWARTVDAQLSTILPETNEEYAANANSQMFGMVRGVGAPKVPRGTLPAKIQKQITKKRLPQSGETPFAPRFTTNRKGQKIVQTAEVEHGPQAGRKGVVDTEGRIWLKDEAHAGYPEHWDVQIDSGKDYFRVGIDGNAVARNQ